MNNQYAEEARRRFGETDAYRESEQRTANYTEQDWSALSDGMDAVIGGQALRRMMKKRICMSENSNSLSATVCIPAPMRSSEVSDRCMLPTNVFKQISTSTAKEPPRISPRVSKAAAHSGKGQK